MTDTIEVDDFGLVVTGIKAQELLDNPVFSSTVNELSVQITDALLNTELDAIQTRQNLYMMHKALMHLVNILKASAAVGPIVNAQMPENPEDENTELHTFPDED